MREGEHHMEVRGVYNFRPALVHPYLLKDCLAAGTVSVPAGIVMDLRVTAFCTDAGAVSKLSGFAAQDVMGCFFLDGGLENSAFAVRFIGRLENLLDLKILAVFGPCGNAEQFFDFYVSHEPYLPAGQKDWRRLGPAQQPDGHSVWWNPYNYDP